MVHLFSLWKFVNWIGVSLQFREIWKFNVPVNLVGFCKCLWITFGQIYYITTWLNNNGMDNRTNLSTTNNGVDNLPKPVQKRFTICPKHLQDHTKFSNTAIFHISLWKCEIKSSLTWNFTKTLPLCANKLVNWKSWPHSALFLVELP